MILTADKIKHFDSKTEYFNQLSQYLSSVDIYIRSFICFDYNIKLERSRNMREAQNEITRRIMFSMAPINCWFNSKGRFTLMADPNQSQRRAPNVGIANDTNQR